MRKALNENPMVQIGALAALGLLVAVVFMTSMGGGGTEPEAATDAPATPSAAAATPTDPAAAVTPAPQAPATSSPGSTLAGETPFEAGKGLPAPLVKAYESGDVVVLLVTQENGIEDKPIERDVEKLESRGDTSVFISDVKDVSDYSRIAEGVSLESVPAIIVLHPLKGKLAKGEAPMLPAASVSYGYRGPESVAQTVRDVLYDGKLSSYDP
ncbi:MAG: hypothetical protein M3355_00470 [Actinomycetota bacterium]|nr:hypothetical protein [Actinomycetota bacterium]